MLWHADPLLGNDGEIISHTTAQKKQQKNDVFVQSVPRCYKQDKLMRRERVS
jgi:hypothetical protein